jgi:hypothetical protein
LNTALDDLQAVMFKWKDRQSVIKPKLDCRGQGNGVRWWRLQLVDETDNGNPNTWYHQQFEDCINWADKTLKDWPDCKRMSFDMWDFKYRKDAEKFITLFYLSWEQ